MPQPFIVTPDAAPSPLRIVGEQVTVLASGAQTGGYEIFLQSGPDGGGPPPHSHPWDESFYVIKGEIAFGIDTSEAIAQPGTLVHLPAGTTHWFRFCKGGGEMLSMTSCEGASCLFADLDREIAPEKPDLGKLIEVGQRHGLAVVPTSSGSHEA
jgi:quercetin dioxygenase-like cupin family protein